MENLQIASILIKERGSLGQVYTPGFVVNGREWKGWFSGKALPSVIKSTGTIVGQLRSNKLTITYGGDENPTLLNVAITGSGFKTRVKKGENKNRTLRGDFVVLEHLSFSSKNNRWNVKLPSMELYKAENYAIVLWVTKVGSIKPLQATGAWLK